MIKSKIKICGIKDIETINCCIENKVDFYGMIFYKKSPRNISVDDAKVLLKYSKGKNISSVGVFVNEPTQYINKIIEYLKFDFIQLHGVETNDQIKSIKKNNRIKIIKVISVKKKIDFMKTSNYPDTDFFLFDYKPTKKELPGGNAKAFDWKLINNIFIEKPWFLSGGINIKNINEIKNYSIPYGIDISSGVEVSLGIKNNYKIYSLMKKYGTK